MLLLDLYVFQVIKALASGASEKTRLIIYSVYWTLSISAVAFLLFLPYFNTDTWPKTFRNYLFATFVGLFVAKLLAAIFFVVDDARRGITWVLSKIFPETDTETNTNAAWNLSRSAFLSWLGIGFGGSFLGTFIYGFSNKYNYRTKRIQLTYHNLPAGFKGLKIVHISDIHSGSFGNKEAVQKGVDMVLKENADIILFTGDLVNDHAEEMRDYKDVFSKLKATMGVFSTLGNHDYGDYVSWDSPLAKKQNLETLKQVHGQMGWRLLMNEHTVLERNGDAIAFLE